MEMASKYIFPCFRIKGNRIKKVKDNEFLAYRNELVAALDRSKGKLEGSWNALQLVLGKPDYQKYGEQLFDILYTGGLLTTDGKLPTRGELKLRTNYCVFTCHDDLNALRVYEHLVKRLRRKYKHLDMVFEMHFQRLLSQLGGFEMAARRRLAMLLTLYLIDGNINPRTLLALGEDQSNIDNGLTLEFMLVLCVTLKRERGSNFMLQMLKKSGLDGKIISYMPPMLRSDLYFRQVYQENDLNEVIKLHETLSGQELKNQLQERLLDDIREKLPHVEMILNIRQFQREHHMSDSEIINIVWYTINANVNTNAGPNTIDHFMARLQKYAPLLNALCGTDSTKIALLLRLQEWCYEHHALFRSFGRLAVHLYKVGVINEDAIVRWYEVDHFDKGKVSFLSQMRPFVQWLNSERHVNAQADYNGYQQPVYSDAVTSTNASLMCAKYR